MLTSQATVASSVCVAIGYDGDPEATAAAFGPLGWWGAIGLVPIATALIGWCPAYRLLGINTCARPST
jgi:hypothetical protein